MWGAWTGRKNSLRSVTVCILVFFIDTMFSGSYSASLRTSWRFLGTSWGHLEANVAQDVKSFASVHIQLCALSGQLLPPAEKLSSCGTIKTVVELTLRKCDIN